MLNITSLESMEEADAERRARQLELQQQTHRTPSPGKKRVTLRNPMHSGKRASATSPSRGNTPLTPGSGIPINRGSPEMKSPGSLEEEEKREKRGKGSPPLGPLTSPPPGKRPNLGPPGGWVREDKKISPGPNMPNKNNTLSYASPSGLSESGSPVPTSTHTHKKQIGILSADTNSLSSDLSYSKSPIGIGMGMSQSQSLSLSLSKSQGMHSQSTSQIELLRPTLMRKRKKVLNDPKLAPRPSGFTGAVVPYDGFAPGVDPTNFIEQDKRLGYQKPRMFFPLPGPQPTLDMMPQPRNIGIEITPDAIVQEFLQMRALLSYVGDMVNLPYTNTDKKITKTKQGLRALAAEGSGAKPLRRLAGVLDETRYDTAVNEAIQLWNPMVGAHLPPWAQKAKRDRDAKSLTGGQVGGYLLTQGGNKNKNSNKNGTDYDPAKTPSALRLGDSYGNAPMERPPWEPDPLKSPVDTGMDVVPLARDDPEGADAEKRVLFTKKVLRKLLKKERRDARRQTQAMRDAQDALVNSEFLSQSQVEHYQGGISDAFQDAADTYKEEISEINNLMLETIRVQYATLPQRFLLAVEGTKANPRQLIGRVRDIFCRVKARNLVTLAWGVWKSVLVLAESERRKPIYSRYAACFLMKEWASNRKLKQMRKQISAWRRAVAMIIFAERNKSVLPMQTLYRKYRDRCLIMRLHLQGAYDGPLSDIELGVWREDIKFKIPRVIRGTRRDIWYGVVKIQTNFRRWSVYRHTLKRRRQVVLMQSVIRMFPKRERYKRLRYHTVRMQAWVRRRLARLKWCYTKIQAVVVQKYIRRYLKQCWKHRVYNRAWRIQEKRIAAAILLQMRWREYKAKKRIHGIISYRKERFRAALVLQRVWFKNKKAFHTFALMCCLRAAEEEDMWFNKMITMRGRFCSARVIQRPYVIRFFRRNVASAVKIQCQYRGHRGTFLIEKLRREKWACRRLCHWARGALRRKMKTVRTIQRAWWKYKKGYFLRHLFYRARQEDLLEDKIVQEKKFWAACRMQAMVLGMRARVWLKHTKAVLIIQRPVRFFIARMGWKKQARMKNKKVVSSYINSMIAGMVKRRAARLVEIHSAAMIGPQAIARVRLTIMKREVLEL